MHTYGFFFFYAHHSAVWSPSNVHIRDMLANVQRRFMRRIRGVRKLEYDQRPAILRLSKLKQSKVHNDILLAYNAIHSISSSGANDTVIELRLSNARGNDIRTYHYRQKQRTILQNTFKASSSCSTRKQKISRNILSRQSLLVINLDNIYFSYCHCI